MSDFDHIEGGSPLVISMPHTGTLLPDDLATRYNPVGHSVCDTDWHIDRLYNFAADLDATVIAARWSRWVIDLNRDPHGAALYPGSFETGLCPMQTFAKEPIYAAGQAPDDAEVARRLDAYWRPYHRRLRAALDAARARHGYALLLDAHSIVSECPLLFEGRLPDINFGTNSGRSCSPAVIAAATEALAGHDFTYVVDGRFKGGWITRSYGRPDEGIHALQIELAQAAYMDEEAPRDFDPMFAQLLRDALRDVLAAATKAAAGR